jgi:MoxR-like ATPase
MSATLICPLDAKADSLFKTLRKSAWAGRDGAMTIRLTEELGVYGWSYLDPVLLAALALEAPVLLVGPHGTAKSLLIERLASAAGLAFRHYNASLLNYDDLVGIPLPEDDTLRFISTPGAIWEAEFAFFDELSRCRADLLNKLFPIIHERRVAGISLTKLQHRWAAMNPPAPEEVSDLNNVYIGAEAIDPALADRFLFVIPVPAWDSLRKEDQQKLLTDTQPSLKAEDLTGLVDACRTQIAETDAHLRKGLGDYVITFINLLYKSNLPESPRRARMLMDGIIAVHAAQKILQISESYLAKSAELAARFGLPQTASATPPSITSVLAAHKQAWEISGLQTDNKWKSVLLEPDPVKRILLADRLKMDDAALSKLITKALSSEPSEARLAGLSAIIFLKYRSVRDLKPSTWEQLTRSARRILEPNTFHAQLPPGADLQKWIEINSWSAGQPNTPRARLERNYILSGFPDLWRQYNWKDALRQFNTDLDLFNLNKEIG